MSFYEQKWCYNNKQARRTEIRRPKQAKMAHHDNGRGILTDKHQQIDLNGAGYVVFCHKDYLSF
ncbi:MAG: hypothetical protein ACX93T_01230 [Bacteroidota bacterium]